MIKEQTYEHNVEQGIAAYVDYLNTIRINDLIYMLDSILTYETENLSDITQKTVKALSNIDLTQLEINNLIEINRGGDTGIHGFISEFAETGIRNARDIMQGFEKSVVLLNDNGVADILLQGQEVQMKFYNGILGEIRQSSNYGDMKMMFPKDHVEVINKIMNGAKTVDFNGNNLTNSQINNIKVAIENESAIRGVAYDKWIEESVLNYRDVQKEAINETLATEVKDIKNQSKQQKVDIKNKAEDDRLNAQQESKPTFAEASKAAGIGAAVQGGLNLGIFIYRKHKEGKEVWEFENSDWKECGVSTAKGAIKGGISGYAIYGLTNVCHLAAPSAGAITSGTFGLTNAVIKYRKSEVDTDGFIDLVTLNAIDATGAAIGAAIGQVVIPIPVVGALIGSIVTTTTLSLGKGIFNKHELEVINQYQNSLNDFIKKLDVEYQEKLKMLLDEYHKLGELQSFCFDLDLNIQLRFISSIDLAKQVGVDEEKILTSEEEIDDYFLA